MGYPAIKRRKAGRGAGVMLAVILNAGAAWGTCLRLEPACLIQEARAGADALSDRADRDEVYFEIVITLAGRGEGQSALALAGQIGNPTTFAEAEAEIAIAEAQQGNFETAMQIAMAILDSRENSVRVMALEQLAMEQAKRGAIDTAFETVLAIDNPYRRSEAEANIAKAIAHAKDMDGAFRASARIATSYWFSSGQPQFKVASGIVSRSTEFDDYWFYEALVSLAVLQARAGDVVGALRTARSIPDLESRSRATSGISIAQADSGDIGGALDTARRIEAAYGDSAAMIAIAGAKVRAGNAEGARDLAQQIWIAYGNDAGFAAVAVEQVRAGAVADGLRYLDLIKSQQTRTRALRDIGQILASAGKVDEAVAVVSRIDEAGERDLAFEVVTTALARIGLGTRALAVAQALADGALADKLSISVLVEMARAGDSNTGLAAAYAIADPMSRNIALAELARLGG